MLTARHKLVLVGLFVCVSLSVVGLLYLFPSAGGSAPNGHPMVEKNGFIHAARSAWHWKEGLAMLAGGALGAVLLLRMERARP